MKLPSFITKNKAPIMLLAGIAGFVATNYLTAKGAVKQYEERQNNLNLSLKEELKIAAKCYAPAVTCGLVSAGLIFGGNKTYAKTQAGLLSAYTLANTRFKNERDAVLKTFGLDGLTKVDDQIKQPLIEEMKKQPVSQGSILVCDTFGKEPRFLETTMEELQQAEYEFNRRFSKNGEINVNYFYELLGFEQTMEGETFGFNAEYLYDKRGDCWIDFDHELVLEDNNQYYILKFAVEPIAGYQLY